MKVQFLGSTRWSYPGARDDSGKNFRKADKDLAALRAKLYAPHRLAHRLFLLEHVLLPGLRGQSAPGFTHLFVMGDQLPEPWRSRVLDLLKTVPQIVPILAPEGQDIDDLLAREIAAHTDPACDVLAQYRIDDDDAVAHEFIAGTGALFGDMQPFYRQDGIAALDYTRGFIMKTTDGELGIRPVSARFWAPGMVIFQDRAQARPVYEFPHLRVWHDMPVLTWKEKPMFLRGAHHDNDSGLGDFASRSKSFGFNPRSMTRYMRRNFGMELREMHRIWDQDAAWFMGQEMRKAA